MDGWWPTPPPPPTNQPTNYTNMIIVHLQLWRPDHRTTSADFNLDEIKQDIY